MFVLGILLFAVIILLFGVVCELAAVYGEVKKLSNSEVNQHEEEKV